MAVDKGVYARVALQMRALSEGDMEAVQKLKSLHAADLSIGSVVLLGDHNWREGAFWSSICALVAGRRHTFEHLGLRCTIAWWRDQPYLIRVGEARS